MSPTYRVGPAVPPMTKEQMTDAILIAPYAVFSRKGLELGAGAMRLLVETPEGDQLLDCVGRSVDAEATGWHWPDKQIYRVKEIRTWLPEVSYL